MKPRRVFISLEVETDLPLKDIKRDILACEVMRGCVFDIQQVQVNSIKPKRKPKS